MAMAWGPHPYAGAAPRPSPFRRSCAPCQMAAFFRHAALTLGEAAPDTEPLVVVEGVLKAFGTHFAGEADLLRLAGGSALLGKEGLGVGLGAQRALLPAEFLVRVLDQQLLEQLGHVRPSSVSCVPVMRPLSMRPNDTSEITSV